MRKLLLVAVAAAAIFQAPLPLIAQDGGGSPALVPVSDIPAGAEPVPGTGAVEAPAAPPPAPPAPAPEDAPALVPTEDVAAPQPPPPADMPAAVPDPDAAPQLRPRAELAQDQPTGPDLPEDQEPNEAPDPTPDEETDPEEFEEDFNGGGEPDPAPGGGTPAPRADRAAAIAERLPETGVRLAALALASLALLSWGTGLRLLVPPARRA